MQQNTNDKLYLNQNIEKNKIQRKEWKKMFDDIKKKKRTNQSNVTQRTVRENKANSKNFKDLDSSKAKYLHFCVCL